LIYDLKNIPPHFKPKPILDLKEKVEIKKISTSFPYNHLVFISSQTFWSAGFENCFFQKELLPVTPGLQRESHITQEVNFMPAKLHRRAGLNCPVTSN
jgi:hypothetical protein